MRPHFCWSLSESGFHFQRAISLLLYHSLHCIRWQTVILVWASFPCRYLYHSTHSSLALSRTSLAGPTFHPMSQSIQPNRCSSIPGYHKIQHCHSAFLSSHFLCWICNNCCGFYPLSREFRWSTALFKSTKLHIFWVPLPDHCNNDHGGIWGSDMPDDHRSGIHGSLHSRNFGAVCERSARNRRYPRLANEIWRHLRETVGKTAPDSLWTYHFQQRKKFPLRFPSQGSWRRRYSDRHTWPESSQPGNGGTSEALREPGSLLSGKITSTILLYFSNYQLGVAFTVKRSLFCSLSNWSKNQNSGN